MPHFQLNSLRVACFVVLVIVPESCASFERNERAVLNKMRTDGSKQAPRAAFAFSVRSYAEFYFKNEAIARALLLSSARSCIFQVNAFESK